MSALFGSVKSSFEIVGEVIDRRLVTSEKMKDWQLHILKVAAKGCTLEVQVTKDEYEGVALKQPYHLVGYLTMEAGRTKLIAESVKLIDAKPRAAS